MRKVDRVLNSGVTVPQRLIHRLKREWQTAHLSRVPRNRVWQTQFDVAVICPSYPGSSNAYGGQFVQSRVNAYRAAGLTVAVLVIRPQQQFAVSETIEGTPVWRTSPTGLSNFLKRGLARRAVVHHPESHIWAVLKAYTRQLQPIAIIHGYEARSWRETALGKGNDTSTPELNKLDAIRRITIADVLSDTDTTPVFVSAFMRGVAERFSGVSAPDHSKIIHNPILTKEFPFQKKDVSHRFRILWLRSFNSHNYANDLSRDAVLELSKRPIFEHLSFTVVGDGRLWEETVGPLHPLKNVNLQRGFVPRNEVSQLHLNRGVLLCPTRWDSQGLTCGEAMSSGMVAVTNQIAAIPEFISSNEGVLCQPEDAIGLADAIEDLATSPSKFSEMSYAAGQRVRKQCGLDETVGLEIKLIRA